MFRSYSDWTRYRKLDDPEKGKRDDLQVFEIDLVEDNVRKDLLSYFLLNQCQ